MMSKVVCPFLVVVNKRISARTSNREFVKEVIQIGRVSDHGYASEVRTVSVWYMLYKSFTKINTSA